MHFKEWITNLPAYKPPRLIGRHAEHVVKLSSNENALGPSPRAIEAMRDMLPYLHRYPDTSSLELRQALARHAELPVDSVLCSNGSDEMVFLLCVAFLREGDEAVMAEGTFISYLLRTLVMGAKAVRVPLTNYTHDLEAMVEAITPATRLLFICNPNNPTGTSNSADEVSELLQRVPDDVLVVVDEAYLEYVTRKDYPNLLPTLRSGRKNLLLLRTFAKIYGLAGLRLGYAYGDPEVIAYLNRVRPTFNVNVLAQAAGIAAIRDVVHVARSRAHTDACHHFFTRELGALGLSPLPSQANFLAVDVGDDTAVADALLHHGFTVTPLTGWGVPGFIRFSYGNEEQNQRFMHTLASVLAARAS